MARLNTAGRRKIATTHEGAPAFPHLKPYEQLRRTALAALLWEDQFYEGGESIANRIISTAVTCRPEQVAQLAVEARSVYHLRHLPLLLLCALQRMPITQHYRGPALIADTIATVIERADELTELLEVYWKVSGRKPGERRKGMSVPAQMRNGLARAITKFTEHDLAKYDRNGATKLRDVLRLVRPRPANDKQRDLWGRVLRGELAIPDTWETALSAGADKKETFTRLLTEGRLGYLALLRNLRNMEQAGVDRERIIDAILDRRNGAHRVLPFRFVAAARAAPSFEAAIDRSLLATLDHLPRPAGTTMILVDVSQSMDARLSGKSDLTRRDAAATLAAMWPGDVRVFTFSNALVEVPPRRGMAGVDAINRSQPHGGTRMGAALTAAQNYFPHDRLIIISDEESQDPVPAPIAKRAYMINVASSENGVGYGEGWTAHITGFSEQVLRFIIAIEAEQHEGR